MAVIDLLMFMIERYNKLIFIEVYTMRIETLPVVSFVSDTFNA